MSDDPKEIFEAPVHHAKTGWRFKTIAATILWGAIAVVLLGMMFLPPTRGARGAARRNACLNNVRQIALAIQSYHDEFGHLPPAFTVDADGNRLHSWRTLILPYLEEVALYEQIDLTKPWDDPANAEARQRAVSLYLCPAALHEDERFTTYMAIVGPEFAFTGSEPRKMSEAPDARKTILVVDASSDHAVHWMSPHDLNEEELFAILANSELSHGPAVPVAFADARATAIPPDVDPKLLSALLRIDGDKRASSEL